MLHRLIRLFVLLAACSLSPASAADWGYDDEPKAAVQKKVDKAVITKAPRQAPVQPTLAPVFKERVLTDLDSWMEIFTLVATSPTEDDRLLVPELGTLDIKQKAQLKSFIEARLKLPQYADITPSWQTIRKQVALTSDHKLAYRSLFRALLRHWLLKTERAGEFDGHSARAMAVSLDDKNKGVEHKARKNQDEDLFADLIGPTRTLAEGPPPLTHEAVLAYTDMTCFLYARTHPDKTVDDQDNRDIFSQVVVSKFSEAPGPKERMAMSNFDLTWAAFRCLYLDSDSAAREKMVKTLAGAAGSSPADRAALISPVVKQFFSRGPWGENIKAVSADAKSR